MSINKFIGTGRVGKDPDVKTFDGGNSIAVFSLALSERGYTLQNGTQVPERTDWVNCLVRGGLVKVAEQCIKRGSHIAIVGKLRVRSYDDKEGKKVFVTEIHIDDLELLDKKQEQESSGNSNHPYVQGSPNAEASPDPASDLPF